MGRDSGTIIDSKRGRGMLWSRGEESIGESFSRKFWLPSRICLRAFVWTGKFCLGGGEAYAPSPDCSPVSEKKTRVLACRKKESVRFQVYDLLKINGKDMRKFPMHQRRSKLEELLQGIPEHLPIGISPLVEENTWSQLEERSSGIEGKRGGGIHVKEKNSSYESGRVKGAWYKWKIDPFLR